MALGTTVDDLLAADAVAVLPRIVETCGKAGVTVGAFAGDAAKAARLRELGFREIAVAIEATVVAEGRGTFSAPRTSCPPGTDRRPSPRRQEVRPL